MLEQFTLPKLNDSSILELQYCKSRYDYADIVNDKRVSKAKTKKEAIAASFEILSSLFNFDYDEKVVFNKDSFNKEIYLDNIQDSTFEEVFYKLYYSCFIKYIKNLHNTNLNKIEDRMYKIVKLALLNKNEEIIDRIIKNCYREHMKDILSVNFTHSKICVKDIASLIEENNKRNINLKNEVMQYSLLNDLSRYGMINLFSCFSNDIFKKLTIDEKVHIANLVFNYFSIDGKLDLYNDLRKKINKDTNSKECLKIVINKLMRKGNTMIIRKKNMDMINDVLSWLSIIYNNETDKNNVNSLDDLNELINNIKRA